MKEIEQNNKYRVLRRIQEDWSWITEIVEEGLELYYPCDYDEETYLDKISVDAANTYLYNYLDNWRTETFSILSDHISLLVKKRARGFVLEYYNYIKQEECE